ncbi:MAG TPA: ribose-phosphate pyrophosphokinase [Planctomycetota bacterium]|nr:ribose-phosphate pyrophosphokinase [Planctomycetota bacterium]
MERLKELTLISGSAHPQLARDIAIHLDKHLADAATDVFPDGECNIKVNEDIRGRDVFVIQPTCPPVNNNWVELLLLLDTLRRSSAGRITAVMPYFGYARKDRKDEGRVPISAKVVANTLVGAGADRVVTLDMHAPQIQGFFDVPVDHLYARPVLMQGVQNLGIQSPVVVTPDVGGTKMARAYAKRLHADLAIVDKRRMSGSETIVEHVIGEVAGRNCVLVDDMISTAGSITQAAAILRQTGAKSVVIAVTHAVLCGPAIERLAAAPVDRILATDSVPQDRANLPSNMEICSVAPLIAQAIRNIHLSESVSSLFE